ncbi:hypothetical protein ACFZDP_48385 [Streptomyces mirabilis]|uniref:hypothetical protein n=1 Tax=Streptomyces mirabilis TaxID=68239 RepID=UPI0036E06696
MIDRPHVVTDAHGRPTDLTSNTPVHACRCDEHVHLPTTKARHWAKASVAIVAILTTGALVSVLLLVVRDVASAAAGTSVAGFLLKLLFAPSNRRDR